MRPYQTIRCGRFLGVKTSDVGGRGRRQERNPIAVHSRRVIRRQCKRGDRARAIQSELRIEHDADVEWQRECDAMLRQFEEECRPPTEQELEEERLWFVDHRYDGCYDDYYSDSYRDY